MKNPQQFNKHCIMFYNICECYSNERAFYFDAQFSIINVNAYNYNFLFFNFNSITLFIVGPQSPFRSKNTNPNNGMNNVPSQLFTVFICFVFYFR